MITYLKFLKRFIFKCYRSLHISIYVDWFPAFPHPNMNLNYFEKKWHLEALKHPIRLLCIKANWKLSKNIFKHLLK